MDTENRGTSLDRIKYSRAESIFGSEKGKKPESLDLEGGECQVWWQRQKVRRLKRRLEPDCEGLEWWRRWEATAEA